MNGFWLGLILSVLPITELRGGLPVALHYATKNDMSVWPVFFLILFLNIAVIWFVFFFLDFLHDHFMKISLYGRVFGFFINRVRQKAEKVKAKLPTYGYLALTLYVAIPLPVTGAYTGCLIAWLLGLDRKKSVVGIALGVCIAGVLILLASLGVLTAIDDLGVLGEKG